MGQVVPGTRCLFAIDFHMAQVIPEKSYYPPISLSDLSSGGDRSLLADAKTSRGKSGKSRKSGKSTLGWQDINLKGAKSLSQIIKNFLDSHRWTDLKLHVLQIIRSFKHDSEAAPTTVTCYTYVPNLDQTKQKWKPQQKGPCQR